MWVDKLKRIDWCVAEVLTHNLSTHIATVSCNDSHYAACDRCVEGQVCAWNVDCPNPVFELSPQRGQSHESSGQDTHAHFSVYLLMLFIRSTAHDDDVSLPSGKCFSPLQISQHMMMMLTKLQYKCTLSCHFCVADNVRIPEFFFFIFIFGLKLLVISQLFISFSVYIIFELFKKFHNVKK